MMTVPRYALICSARVLNGGLEKRLWASFTLERLPKRASASSKRSIASARWASANTTPRFLSVSAAYFPIRDLSPNCRIFADRAATSCLAFARASDGFFAVITILVFDAEATAGEVAVAVFGRIGSGAAFA